MSSLANLPEVIGFFSYSREDDEAFRGTLSALRDAIQRELGAQLGRSKRNFRLWQDQEAISPGKLWESEIKTAVEQSVFFIPIVTPRVVNSEYCQFEFESFLARERSLGRADLVFPILYISVPALEDETQWRNHPVLSAIARRQYVDWRSMRHVDIQSTVVREAIERFCRKIVEALQQSWQSPEERRRQEEAEAQTRAEEERHRQEVETKRRAEEDARRRHDEAEAQRIADERLQQEAEAKRRADEEKRQAQTEAEARQRAEEERRGREVEAKQRADQERAFAAAKRADTAAALDRFLMSYPASDLAAEAKALRAALIERDNAHKQAMSSDDPRVLKAFLDRYPAGKPAGEVHNRLRWLGLPPRRSQRLVLTIGIGLVVLGIAAVGAVIFDDRGVTAGLFLTSGAACLVATLLIQPRPDFWWVFRSATISFVVGSIVAGVPAEIEVRLIDVLLALFLVEGIAILGYAIYYRRWFSAQWGWTISRSIISFVSIGLMHFGFSARLVVLNLLADGTTLIAMELGIVEPLRWLRQSPDERGRLEGAPMTATVLVPATKFARVISEGFSNYFDFSGRAARSEFWLWVLFCVVAIAVTVVVPPICAIFILSVFLPSMAIGVRRLHDLDRTGWWMLLSLVPLAGPLALVVLSCLRGTQGPNRFGPDHAVGGGQAG
jgi:uncharacterized membrane protein YhaH (DUF805 family)